MWLLYLNLQLGILGAEEIMIDGLISVMKWVSDHLLRMKVI